MPNYFPHSHSRRLSLRSVGFQLSKIPCGAGEFRVIRLKPSNCKHAVFWPPPPSPLSCLSVFSAVRERADLLSSLVTWLCCNFPVADSNIKIPHLADSWQIRIISLQSLPVLLWSCDIQKK